MSEGLQREGGQIQKKAAISKSKLKILQNFF